MLKKLKNQNLIDLIGRHLPKIIEINNMALDESKFDDVYNLIKEASDQRDLATILYYHSELSSTLQPKMGNHSIYLTSACRGNIQLTKDFVECGANIYQWDICEDTLIHIFAENGYCDALKYFMKYEHDINKQDKDGNTPLHLAILNEEYEICKYLCNYSGINKKIKNNEKETPLDIARRLNLNDIKKMLI
ncbi:hypothetical protein TVAG_083190 [Trichomonas vaginalis G3]|uniref:Uncharacterized protein n=1 Tax=Trichomonas vaginalis (strain ATCC PRA-98 / G3) TaxID=412133 RepID=A2DM46_TRIV3|nr:protein ubiquitination [Trichomonas vaginalis G3]EAY18466.1 hypothetical protein TVAG_083190 [Trichomonas vaginalis G3]KAI5489545.1 protein ubiquitination [Trichomonas vaginalis G3]|eukprot:XP_001579452.1 hypothetical protein [Trichomonas vaginalis G3]